MASQAALKTVTKRIKPEQGWASARALKNFQYEHIIASNKDIIEPKFWYGDLSNSIPDTLYTIDGSEYANDLSPKNTALVKRMEAMYDHTGFIYIKNTGLTDMQKMKDLANIIIPETRNYEGGSNWRNHIETNVYDTGAPKEAWLHYHHEMAYVGESVDTLAFCCGAATPGKGATFVSDGVQTTNEILKHDLGLKLKDKGICYTRCLSDREFYKNKIPFDVYNHWQQSFGTENMDEATELANRKGLNVEWVNHPRWGRYMVTKYYTSAFEYDSYSDRNLLYSSIADHHSWFDTWPGVNELSPEERPLKITYGDNTDFTTDELRTFVHVYDKFGIPLNWNVGDVVIICNKRWAHGRPRYCLEEGEERELGVVLGPLNKRKGQRNDKW